MQPNDLLSLSKRIYQASLRSSDHERLVDVTGQPVGKMIDSRKAILDAANFNEVGAALAQRLQQHKVQQIVGQGFGSFGLVCSVLSTGPELGFKAGLLRDTRKTSGRLQLVEGPIERTVPVVLIDDMLVTGKTARRNIQTLRQEGYNVVGVLALFCYTISNPAQNLQPDGVWVDWLFDLTNKSKDTLQG